MDATKTISIVVIIASFYMMYLQSKGKLRPALNAVASTNTSSSTQTNQPSMSSYIVAIIVFILILSFLPEKGAIWLTVIVIFGALLVNSKQFGSKDVIHSIFGG